MNHTLLDMFWLLMAGVLVLIMQGGFLCLESGATRSKNAINVAMKNAADFIVSVIFFWIVGFALMFGESHHGIMGISQFFTEIGLKDSWVAAFFIFQVMFCATAATIVSGAIAERVKFNSYLLITMFVVTVIYPISGHWAWGGALDGDKGWLAHAGFVDFAGSTVVHSVGGWVALAALLIIGPRTGRFKNGILQNIPGSNPTLALLGVILFVVGWVGFNGGSTLAWNNAVPGIVANTILAAAAGAAIAYIICKLFPDKVVDPTMSTINGVLAGLVSITANCHSVTAVEAFIIGSVGAIVMLCVDWLLMKFQIDDAIGAVPVHLGAGIWGTIAVALFGDPVKLGTNLDFPAQLQVQIMGIVTIGAWAFTIAYIILKIMNRLSPLRVSEEEEHIGLNVSEHGAKTELIDLLSAMQHQEQSANLSIRVPVEPFTEVGQIAAGYNRVMSSLEKAVMQTKTIVKDIRDGIITFGQDGILTSFNPGAEQIFGLVAADAIGTSFCTLLDRKQNNLCLTRDSSEQKPKIENITRFNKDELIGTRADNSTFYMELTVTESIADNTPQYTALVRDITDRKRVEEQLYQEKERALITLESIADGVITTTADGIIQYMNKAAEVFTGWTLQEAQGHVFQEVYNVMDENMERKSSSLVVQVLHKHKAVSDTTTYTLTSRDGNEHAVNHTASPIKDRNNITIGSVIVFHDVTSTRAMQQQLSHQATHDNLTGLKNRNAFESKAVELIKDAHAEGNAHVLCYLDLDQFKLVNDTCGHIAGDELLRQVSLVISDHMRKGDILARLGGDEFGVLLYNCSIDDGLKVAEDIREAIREFRFPWEGKQFSIGVSIGLVSIGQETENLSELLKLADAACYAAKDLGRNRVHVYEPDDIELATRQGQMQWVARIRDALDHDRLRLYYQSIVPTNNIKTNEIRFELFVRMLDDEGNVIPPGAFIPAAERYDMMKEIDQWVVCNALAWLGDHCRRKTHNIVYCSINLSGASVGDKHFLDEIKYQLKRNKIPKGIVCFEVTETAAVSNMGTATKFIDELKQIGCKFALDDFGSGLSSFGYLKHLPVDYLKIDGAFIKDIDKNTMDYAMVQSIHTIGKLMNLNTVAEFVENAAILNCLDEIGIDYAQGFYIDHPRPLEQLETVTFMPR